MCNRAEHRARTKARPLHDLRCMQHIERTALARVTGGTDDRDARHPQPQPDAAPNNLPLTNPYLPPPSMQAPPGGGGNIMPGRSPLFDYR